MEFKNLRKWMFRTYLAAYVTAGGYALFDAAKNSDTLENTPQLSDIREYDVSIDGKVKHLTLVGEVHSYNRKESEIAKELVERNTHVAGEGFSFSIHRLTPGNYVFGMAAVLPATPYYFFCKIGSGRMYPSLGDYAEDKGRRLYELENVNDEFDTMTLLERSVMLASYWSTLFTAPLGYYESKNYAISNAILVEISQNKGIAHRDSVMASTIVDLLHRDDIDTLLAFYGRGHMIGITRNLDKALEMKEQPTDITKQ
jgi:hypothetical protein